MTHPSQFKTRIIRANFSFPPNREVDIPGMDPIANIRSFEMLLYHFLTTGSWSGKFLLSQMSGGTVSPEEPALQSAGGSGQDVTYGLDISVDWRDVKSPATADHARRMSDQDWIDYLTGRRASVHLLVGGHGLKIQPLLPESSHDCVRRMEMLRTVFGTG